MKILSVLILSALTLPLSAMQVEIFTNTMHPVMLDATNVTIDYYNLDETQSLLANFNQGLNAQNVDQRFLANKEKLQHAFHGLNLLQDYDITSIPAIVINQEAIVKGATDLSLAIREYQSWQKK